MTDRDYRVVKRNLERVLRRLGLWDGYLKGLEKERLALSGERNCQDNSARFKAWRKAKQASKI